MTLCTSGSLGDLATALAKAQGELKDALKSSDNPHFRSKYADLAEVLQTVRPTLSKHGLSLVQTAGYYNPTEKTVAVTTMLLHSSGAFIQDTFILPVAQPNAQGVCAAVTYGRRYGASAIIGLASDDDDGETAVGRGSGGKAKGGKAKEAPPIPASSEPNQGDPKALISAFEAVADQAGLKGLAKSFAALPPEDQATVLPSVKAARERLGL